MTSLCSRVFSILALAALLFNTIAFAAPDYPLDDGIYVLTNENFSQFISENANVLVEFYAPWCGHCKNLAPEYVKAAKALEGQDIKLAKVDATEQKEIAEKYNIKGYPTLKYFVSGEYNQDYDSARSSDAIIKWVTRRITPLQVVENSSAMSSLIQENMSLAVAYIPDMSGAELTAIRTVYQRVISTLLITSSKEAFGVAYSFKCAADCPEPEDRAQIVVINKGLGTPVRHYAGSITDSDSIISFVKGEAQLPVLAMEDGIAQGLFEVPISSRSYVFLFSPGPIESSESYKCYHEYASSARNLASPDAVPPYFVYVDLNNEDNAGVLGYFDIPIDVGSQLVALDLRVSNTKYRSDPLPSCEQISAFIDDYRGNRLTPFLKSEPVPEGWNSEPLKLLVGSSFRSVINGSKHAFVKFYVPWCGYCKKLAPDWIKLAEEFSADPDVLVADIESSKNEVPGIDINGYPTLIYFPKSDAEDYSPEKFSDPYQGERTLEALIAWVRSKIAPPAQEEADQEAVKEEEAPEPVEGGRPHDDL